MEIYIKNKKIFEGRIMGNIRGDRKSDIKIRRDSIKKYECVDGEWVFEANIIKTSCPSKYEEESE